MDSTENGQTNRDSDSTSERNESEASSDSQVNSEPAEAVRGEPPAMKWEHGQNLSFQNMKTLLETVRDNLQKSIDQHKRELSKMVGARDSLFK